MSAFLVAWAVVSYVSQFYRDLEMASSIQITLSLTNQLAIVLVIVYAGEWTDISRSYVMLVGGVDWVLLLAGRVLSYSGGLWLRERLGRYHHFLIVGRGSHAREMARLIEAGHGMGLRLIGFVDPNSEGSNLGDRFGRYEVFSPRVMQQVLHSCARSCISSTNWTVRRSRSARIRGSRP
jgi:FlaA1/EpsC-like NDP-sugar epimerase